MTREKKDSANRRVIVDLSWPTGASVNGGTPLETYLDEQYKLQLPTAEDLAVLIAHYGPGCYLWARDLRRAYRQWRLDPLDWPLMGLCVRGQFYVDTAVAFGLRHGAAFAQRVSQSVCDILHEEHHTSVPYIDDVVGVAADQQAADHGFVRAGTLLQELGLEEAPEKSISPTTTLVWIGVEFNTESMTMAIPPAVIKDTIHLVQSWMSKSVASRHDLQVLMGKLFHSAKCSGVARLFVGRMLATLRSAPPQGVVPLSDEFRADLRWFSDFLPEYNGLSLIHVKRPSADITIAAAIGSLSVQWDVHLCSAPIPPGLLVHFCKDTHITLLTVLVALLLWGHLWQDCKLYIHTHDPHALLVLLHGRTRDPYLLHLARASWMIVARRDILIEPCPLMDYCPSPAHFYALPTLPDPDFTSL